MNLVEDLLGSETSLESNTTEELSFLKHLRSSLDQVERLCESMSDKSHDISSNKALLVHSLSTVSPVLNYDSDEELDGNQTEKNLTYFPFKWAC